MIIFTLTWASAASISPEIETSHFKSEKEARASYQEALRNVGDDYVTIALESIDTKTLESKTLEWFEGNYDDLDDPESDDDG